MLTLLLCGWQLEEEKKKVVAEWVGVEDAQREYNKKREAYEIPRNSTIFQHCWL